MWLNQAQRHWPRNDKYHSQLTDFQEKVAVLFIHLECWVPGVMDTSEPQQAGGPASSASAITAVRAFAAWTERGQFCLLFLFNSTELYLVD